MGHDTLSSAPGGAALAGLDTDKEGGSAEWGEVGDSRYGPTTVCASNPNPSALLRRGGGGEECQPQNILAILIFDYVISKVFTSIWQSTVPFTATQIKHSIGSMQSSHYAACLGELDDQCRQAGAFLSSRRKSGQGGKVIS